MFRVPPVSDDLVGLRAETEDSEGAGSISYTPPVFRYLILVAVAQPQLSGKVRGGGHTRFPHSQGPLNHRERCPNFADILGDAFAFASFTRHHRNLIVVMLRQSAFKAGQD